MKDDKKLSKEQVEKMLSETVEKRVKPKFFKKPAEPKKPATNPFQALINSIMQYAQKGKPFMGAWGASKHGDGKKLQSSKKCVMSAARKKKVRRKMARKSRRINRLRAA